MTESWRKVVGGFALDGESGRKFYIDLSHSLPGHWLASERITGALVASQGFQGPQAQEQARQWCESRLNIEQEKGTTTP